MISNHSNSSQILNGGSNNAISAVGYRIPDETNPDEHIFEDKRITDQVPVYDSHYQSTLDAVYCICLSISVYSRCCKCI